MGKLIIYLKEKNVLRSAAVGFLLMRSLPMANVAAGWNLSASFGDKIGEMIAAVIFVLGCSIVLTAQRLENKRTLGFVMTVAAIVYTLSSGNFSGNNHAALNMLDSIMVFAALQIQYAPSWTQLVTAGVLLAAAMVTKGLNGDINAAMLVPLSAALTSGAAIAHLCAEQNLSAGGVLCGMTAVMLADIVI